MRPARSLRTPNHHLVVGLCTAFTITLLLYEVPIVGAALVTGCAGVLFLALLTRGFGDSDQNHEPGPSLLTITLLCFATRVLIGIAIASSSALVEALGPDAKTYHLGALGILGSWNTGTQMTTLTIAAGKEGYFYALAGLYYVFGPYQVAGLVANAALSAALLPITYDTTRRLFGRQAARIAVVIVAVLPSFVVWTSQLLREAAVLFFLALAANAATRLTERTTPGLCATLGASLTILFALRANVALVATAGLIAGVAFGRRSILPGLATGAVTIGLVAMLLVSAGIGYAGFRVASGADLEQVSVARQDLSKGVASGFAPDTDVSTTSKALTFLPVSLPTFAFGPFPWQATNLLQWGGVLEALSLWILVPSAVRGIAGARKVAARRSYALTVPAFLLAASLSLLVGNFGTIVRERLQVTVLLVPLIAYGWTLRRGRSAVRVIEGDTLAASRNLERGFEPQ